MTREETIIQRLTQALKDIVNAADNCQPCQPYDRDGLISAFGEDYASGWKYLCERGIPEGDGNDTRDWAVPLEVATPRSEYHDGPEVQQ